MKFPPIEKIPEAYTAIEDDRVVLHEDYATVLSSTKEKEYLIKWKDNLYYSNDSSTYWQGYVGYPVIAVLMLQNRLPLNREVSKYFKGINWNQLNKENKRDYHKSLEQALTDVPEDVRKSIDDEMKRVFEDIKKLNIGLTKKKDL